MRCIRYKPALRHIRILQLIIKTLCTGQHTVDGSDQLANFIVRAIVIYSNAEVIPCLNPVCCLNYFFDRRHRFPGQKHT
ncbi:hypothetical protein D3C73_1158560 [compost metagenome]